MAGGAGPAAVAQPPPPPPPPPHADDDEEIESKEVEEREPNRFPASSSANESHWQMDPAFVIG